jgi:nitroreductase
MMITYTWLKFGRPEPGVGDTVAGGEAVAEGEAVVAAWNVEAAEVGAGVGLAAPVGPVVGLALPPQAAATIESVSASAVRVRVGPRRVGTLRFSPIGGDLVGFVVGTAASTPQRAAERILIAASMLGLSAGITWIRPERRDAIRDVLALTEGQFTGTVIAIGHPTEAALQPKSAPGEARLPRGEVVFEEKWPTD